MINLDPILQAARKMRVIVIGEIHGVKQNPLFIKDLINKIGVGKVGLVAFEYPDSLQDCLDNILDREQEFKKTTEYEMLAFDGRISDDHVDLIKWLKNKGVQVLALDSAYSPDWNYRDLEMYKNFERMKQSLPKNKISMAIVGNLHSQTTSFSVDKKELVPFASHLKEKVVINLVYGSGFYYNRGLKSFPKIGNPKNKLIERKTNCFDFFVQNATPTKNEP